MCGSEVKVGGKTCFCVKNKHLVIIFNGNKTNFPVEKKTKKKKKKLKNIY